MPIFRYLKGLMMLTGIMTLFSPRFEAAELPLNPIIPLPQKFEAKEGQFLLLPTTKIVAPENLSPEVALLAGYLQPATGFTFPSALKEGGNNEIILNLDHALESLGNEGYKLVVTPNQVRLSAAHNVGLRHAMQSLRQLLPLEIYQATPSSLREWPIPGCNLEDQPSFRWRGLMIDSSRTFWSKAFTKRYIDLLSIYKMNILHMHLVDDQGWRLEIKKYPLLTVKGSTFPKKFNEPPEAEGFYSQTDIRELVAYAQARNVTIVPEIELPGHCLAMLNAYPDLSCTGQPHEIHPFTKGPNIHADIMCAGNEKVFEMLENIFTEVCELFPSQYIHVGGDEAPKTNWKKCSKCQNRIKEEGLKNEHELQSYFIKRIEKVLNQKHRKLIGWDEILEGGLAPNAAVMSWRGIDGGVSAAKSHHNVVMSPTSRCYFDYSPMQYNSEVVYSYNPIPKNLSEDQQKYILGTQANFWSHLDRTEMGMDKQIFPRLCALAEVGWTPQPLKSWSDFSRRQRHNVQRLKILGVNYFKESPRTTVGQWQRPIPENYTIKTWDLSSQIKTAGDLDILFQYSHGSCRLGIEWASLEVNDREVGRDEHWGETGGESKNNTYRFSLTSLPKDAKVTLKASVRAEGGTDSSGKIYILEK